MLTIDVEAQASASLTFQAPKFKYDLTDLGQGYDGTENYNYIKMDIYLPDEEPIYEPMELSRAIFFKVNGQDDS